MSFTSMKSSHLATQTIKSMAGLWGIEADIRGQDPATRMKARQERSAAIVAALFDLWEKELPRLSGKSKLAEAIRCHIQACRPRALLERRAHRDRLQHRRAGHQARDDHHKKKCALRG
jgi:transposase